jgi:hypothetical protein
MLTNPEQFRPSPPPALTSSEFARDFNEVKSLGYISSTVRTAEQTDVAQFWSANSIVQYNTVFKTIAQKQGLNAAQAARLYAMGNLTGADALIACFDAKYRYLFWRPQFAIPQANTAGNPNITADPNWKPLIASPNHPEYPSAHGCYSSAEAEALRAFLGTTNINVDITSSAPNLRQPTRHFATLNELVSEIENVRVWQGIHFRNSVIVGVNLGRTVAQWTLARYFQPTPAAPSTLPTTGAASQADSLWWIAVLFVVALIVGGLMLRRVHRHV